jgi:hypothetical protein
MSLIKEIRLPQVTTATCTLELPRMLIPEAIHSALKTPSRQAALSESTSFLPLLTSHPFFIQSPSLAFSVAPAFLSHFLSISIALPSPAHVISSSARPLMNSVGSSAKPARRRSPSSRPRWALSAPASPSTASPWVRSAPSLRECACGVCICAHVFVALDLACVPSCVRARVRLGCVIFPPRASA